MNEVVLLASVEVAIKRLRDAVRRGDWDDVARISNGLGLHEARALAGGLAGMAFRRKEMN